MIYAPFNYWEATETELASTCNGCGAKDGVKVPNTMWGLDISEACNVHDWMFKYGITLVDFYFANAVFLMNITLILATGSKWLLPFRLARATKYYMAVQEFGHKAYWIDKKHNNDLVITYKGTFK